ncbi:hypothetical protein SGRI78S_06322 [Streptomyces griseus subsp. griseus]
MKGRDLMVQAWYQGGISVWDFTDSTKPEEIAFFERGPVTLDRVTTAGPWSAYYYNGHIYSSDIAKGFDVLKLNDRRTDPAERVELDELQRADAAGLLRPLIRQGPEVRPFPHPGPVSARRADTGPGCVPPEIH